MPELPEVETVCRGIAPHLIEMKIDSVVLNRPDLRVPFPPHFAESLQGRTVAAISRRAKYILIHLDNDLVWLIHLGMSGRLLLGMPEEVVRAKHDHVEVRFSNGMVMVYHDARRFGSMSLATKATLERHVMLAHLGVEPLEEAFNTAYLSERFASKNAPVKHVIMDQEVVVGVGNIYASEALFRSKIHPKTPASEVLPVAELVKSIKDVLREAIASGGSTLRDYVRSNGDSGYFQHQFDVYGRHGKPCVRCATMIERMTQQGRSSFYCPSCQRLASSPLAG